MLSPTPLGRTPRRAGPVRRAFHSVVALAGWVLFIYWWWLVLQHVTRTEVRFTLWFIAIALAVIVVATMLWSFHNVRLFRRKGARTQVRVVNQDASHDSIGRLVGMPAVPEECRTASLVVVRIEDGSKVYRPTVLRNLPQRPSIAPVKP